MTTKDRVLLVLDTLRKASPFMVSIYLYGGCFQLYKLLKIYFPMARPLYDQIIGHVYTEIEGRCYDIEGEKKREKHWIYIESEPNILRKADNWRCCSIPGYDEIVKKGFNSKINKNENQKFQD